MKTVDEKKEAAKKLVQLMVEALVGECGCWTEKRFGNSVDAALTVGREISNDELRAAMGRRAVKEGYTLVCLSLLAEGNWYVDEDTGGTFTVSNFSSWAQSRVILISVELSNLPIKMLCEEKLAGAG